MKFAFTGLAVLFSIGLFSQTVMPDVYDKSDSRVHNREAMIIQGELDKVHQINFDAKAGDGLAIFKNIEFGSGVIEFDVKVCFWA